MGVWDISVGRALWDRGLAHAVGRALWDSGIAQ